MQKMMGFGDGSGISWTICKQSAPASDAAQPTASKHWRNFEMTNTHTHLFNGPFSGTTQVSLYQKGKSIRPDALPHPTSSVKALKECWNGQYYSDNTGTAAVWLSSWMNGIGSYQFAHKRFCQRTSLIAPLHCPVHRAALCVCVDSFHSRSRGRAWRINSKKSVRMFFWSEYWSRGISSSDVQYNVKVLLLLLHFISD